MSKRRNHDAAFKARVAREALKGEKTAAEIATYSGDTLQPGDTGPAVQAGPTICARLGAGYGAMVTLRRPE